MTVGNKDRRVKEVLWIGGFYTVCKLQVSRPSVALVNERIDMFINYTRDTHQRTMIANMV
jgi:hypothetical protein